MVQAGGKKYGDLSIAPPTRRSDWGLCVRTQKPKIGAHKPKIKGNLPKYTYNSLKKVLAGGKKYADLCNAHLYEMA